MEASAVADGADGAGDPPSDEKIEESTGPRKPKKMADPSKPPASEVEEHELTRLPYRSWCWTHAHGRAKHAPRDRAKGERTVPEILECVLMGTRDQPGETAPSLVVREASAKMTMAMAAPSKSTDQFMARRAVAFLVEARCPHRGVIAQSDQEPAVTSIVGEMGKTGAMEGAGRRAV